MVVSPAEPLPPTIAAARAELGAGRLSAVELMESVLARVEQLEPELNSYLHLDAEGALAQARAADGRRERPPLHGIPICVKDVIDVAGMPTTAGSAGWSRQPSHDAVAVERLRAAGAIVVGKGNTNEFAYGIDGRNPHRGDCVNPRDPTRISGGSSSGPAVASAAGMALAGIGTDTTGSTRVPASLCGLVGIRPTLGLIPTRGVVPLAWSYDTVGLLARDVEDASILLDVLAPPPDGRGAEAGAAAAAPEPGVAGLRVALVEELLALAEAPIAERVREAARQLEGAGARIVTAPLPMLRHANAIHQIVQAAEAATAHAPWFDQQRHRYQDAVRRRLEAGRLIPASTYLSAQRARRLLIDEVADAVRDVDVLLAPATPVVAPPRDAEQVSIGGTPVPVRPALLSCVLPISQLDCPSLSIPIGELDQLPFGLQIFGRPFSEPLLLRVATVVERLAGT